VIRVALEFTQTPVPWASVALISMRKAEGAKLTIRLHFVPNLGINGAIRLLRLYLFVAFTDKSFNFVRICVNEIYLR
jgi:hypothetical protein